MHYYSPHTGEHIATNTPAAWMGSTQIPVPDYDQKTQGAFFRDGAWVVETATPPARTAQEEIIAIEAANPISHRNLRDVIKAVGDIASQLTGPPATDNPMIARVIELEAQIAALRGRM